jgi:hypothetical protein
MAYTKIISLNGNLNRAVKYVLNHEKTDLKAAIDYSRNKDKNSLETTYLENSINCRLSTAYADMQHTKEKRSKLGGNLGYHIIQSFAPGETHPKTAHQIGMAFAKKCFGDRFQVVVSTHLDKNHLHNHIVINSVSFVDGKKYRSDFSSYYNGIRKYSDEICRKYGLSVISPDIENRSLTYLEWLGINKGKVTWQSIIKSDIDKAIKDSESFGEFLVFMEHMGNQIKHGKYIAFRPLGKDRYSRGYKLGGGYSESDIRARIDNNEIAYAAEVRSIAPKRNAPYIKRGVVMDLEKSYWRWMYQLDLVKKHQVPPRRSKYLKEELLKLDRYKQQHTFLKTHKLHTESEFFSYVKGIDETLNTLKHNLYGYKQILRKNKKVHDALSDISNYKKAHELYSDGYKMMQPEAQIYEKAVKVLDDSGIKTKDDINIENTKKAGVYEELDNIKSKIKHLKSELKICENIRSTMDHIEEKERQITGKKKETIQKERDD